MRYYSQYGQDKWLYHNYFKEKKKGFFLEIGCIDGIQISNSKFFEDLGWDGICIEPSPSNFEKLKQNRKCICENVAVSNYTGFAKFLDIHGYGQGLSGIIDRYDPRHVNRIERELANSKNEGKTEVEVRVEKLNDILKKHEVTHIDFCTIDTEGSEYDIIESIDLDLYHIDIFLIENNYGDSRNRKFLESKNYRYLGNIQQDEIYRKDI